METTPLAFLLPSLEGLGWVFGGEAFFRVSDRQPQEPCLPRCLRISRSS